jgi:hypothetical protein
MDNLVVIKEPTKIQVENLAIETGESERKCYYWLLKSYNSHPLKPSSSLTDENSLLSLNSEDSTL